MNKYCPSCKEEKSIDDFYNSFTRYDGKTAYCKTCFLEKNKKYLGRDYFRNYSKNRYKNDKRFRDKYLERARVSRILNKEKHTAHSLLNEAVRKGIVKKETNCETCGSSEFINGHHEDYTKPLEVMWLCSSCHKKRHLDKKHLNI